MAATQQTPALFKPIKDGRLTLQHRIISCPFDPLSSIYLPCSVPGPQQASYYSQRGSIPGTLLITEGTFISYDAGGYGNVPGIYIDEQIKGAHFPRAAGSAFRTVRLRVLRRVDRKVAATSCVDRG
ncbi:hypothetical protein L210DRAFT_3582247 [Boletus edulis BED1]|uniref:NADH:flavin oxidoreductase/NADH oxidase N-terminal domain-containing protein n=1 Tax=Boletus edulis BED1 TaxID=1328754 RepID=A0AAD4G5N3_BOLED|nr:hypothetical protein L210DRAFT_3582247 [Boletus edulis BED1]